jgi:hypothetical protein
MKRDDNGSMKTRSRNRKRKSRHGGRENRDEVAAEKISWKLENSLI